MKRIIIAMSIFSFFFGGCSKREDKQNAFSPPSVPQLAKGWICIYNGSPNLIQKAIKSYAENIAKAKPTDFRISVVEHKSGFLSITFPTFFAR